jgi:squalene cyclase
LVKSSPGSLWLAAQALPCHAIQMSTWAMMSVIPPLNLLLLSLAMVSDQLVKISEPSSQTLLCDAVA